MRTHYPDQIRESVEDLEQLERGLRGKTIGDRIKMLRLLKSEVYDSRRLLAGVLGYSERQLQRWWQLYKKFGIDALLEEKAVGGSAERMTDEAWAALKHEIRNGDIKQLKEAQAYLIEQFGIEYQSLQGLSDMIKRRSITDMMGDRKETQSQEEVPDYSSFTAARAALLEEGLIL